MTTKDCLIKELNALRQDLGNIQSRISKIERLLLDVNDDAYTVENRRLSRADGLSGRILSGLDFAGIQTTLDLTYVSVDDIKNIKRFGAKSKEDLLKFCEKNLIPIGAASTDIPKIKVGDRVCLRVDRREHRSEKYSAGDIFVVQKIKRGDDEFWGFSLPMFVCEYAGEHIKGADDTLYCSLGEIELID